MSQRYYLSSIIVTSNTNMGLNLLDNTDFMANKLSLDVSANE